MGWVGPLGSDERVDRKEWWRNLRANMMEDMKRSVLRTKTV